MRFILDESVDIRVASYLRVLGHNTTVVARDYPASLPDYEILALARAEQRTVITNDRDFGELIFRRLNPGTGVLYLRLGTLDASGAVERIVEVLERYPGEITEYITVTPTRIRVRQLPEP
jgi:predicted nuclease of predicted toxin-antitoxin system